EGEREDAGEIDETGGDHEGETESAHERRAEGLQDSALGRRIQTEQEVRIERSVRGRRNDLRLANEVDGKRRDVRCEIRLEHRRQQRAEQCDTERSTDLARRVR